MQKLNEGSMKNLILLIATILFITNGFTESSLVETRSKKIRWVLYDETDIVNIRTQRGYATQVFFDNKAENINQVIGGDTDGWEVYRGNKYIFIKPRSNAISSNLIVVGDKHNYVFGLKVVGANGNPDWQLVIKYQENEDQNTILQNQILRDQEVKSLEELLATDNQIVNCNYTMQIEKNSDNIRPSRVCDDGRYTYITVSNNREIPSIFRINADDSESIVNKHMSGRDTIVVHEVAQRYVLRLGSQAIGIWNESFDIEGNPPIFGTTKNGVVRAIEEKNNE